MLVAVISSFNNIDAIKTGIDNASGQIVLQEVIQECEDDDLIPKKIFDRIKRIYVELLILDVTGFLDNQIYQELRNYRMIKEKTRIMIVSPGATHGDILLSRLVSMGIYDIVTATEQEEIAQEMFRLLQSEPSITTAWRWFSEGEQKAKEESTKSNKILQWTIQIVNAKKDRDSVSKVRKLDEEEGVKDRDTNINHDEVATREQKHRKLIALYSPAPTGKTFIGINLAIAIARAGQKVVYMDCTATCAVKLYFNSRTFPFQLKSLPLWVSGFSQSLFQQEDMVVVLETNTDKYLNLLKQGDNSNIYAVVNSDFTHQIQLAKNLEGKDVSAMIWNEFDNSVDPRDIITLPIITSIPHYSDTNTRIKRGVPQALEDDELAENLLKIYNFNVTRNFLSGNEEAFADGKKEVPAWLRRGENSG